MVWLGVLPILPFDVLSRRWGYFCLSIPVCVVFDLLDFSQLQQGELAIAPQKVELKKVIFEAHTADIATIGIQAFCTACPPSSNAG
jgi:hypothetical protein